MSEIFPTQKVPIPKIRRPGAGAKRKYPFETMKRGSMFFIPNKEKNTMVPHASATGKKLGKKFKTQLCYCKRVEGVWMPCEPDERGATIGIGVWRVE